MSGFIEPRVCHLVLIYVFTTYSHTNSHPTSWWNTLAQLPFLSPPIRPISISRTLNRGYFPVTDTTWLTYQSRILRDYHSNHARLVIASTDKLQMLSYPCRSSVPQDVSTYCWRYTMHSHTWRLRFSSWYPFQSPVPQDVSSYKRGNYCSSSSTTYLRGDVGSYCTG